MTPNPDLVALLRPAPSHITLPSVSLENLNTVPGITKRCWACDLHVIQQCLPLAAKVQNHCQVGSSCHCPVKAAERESRCLCSGQSHVHSEFWLPPGFLSRSFLLFYFRLASGSISLDYVIQSVLLADNLLFCQYFGVPLSLVVHAHTVWLQGTDSVFITRLAWSEGRRAGRCVLSSASQKFSTSLLSLHRSQVSAESSWASGLKCKLNLACNRD